MTPRQPGFSAEQVRELNQQGVSAEQVEALGAALRMASAYERRRVPVSDQRDALQSIADACQDLNGRLLMLTRATGAHAADESTQRVEEQVLAALRLSAADLPGSDVGRLLFRARLSAGQLGKLAAAALSKLPKQNHGDRAGRQHLVRLIVEALAAADGPKPKPSKNGGAFFEIARVFFLAAIGPDAPSPENAIRLYLQENRPPDF